MQQVSSTPATRLDVITLQDELDRRLQQRQARETGICPVRRELYSQCFGNLLYIHGATYIHDIQHTYIHIFMMQQTSIDLCNILQSVSLRSGSL